MKNIVKLALQSVYRSFMRSALTVLSLVIGVAAVIATVGIGNGAKDRVQQSIAALDANRLTLNARKNTEWGWITRFPNKSGLRIEDYYAIRDNISGLTAITPRIETSLSQGQIQFNGRTSNARVIGMGVDGFKLESRKLVHGTLFSAEDVIRSNNVCVVTQSVAQQLASRDNLVGRLVSVRDVPFKVVGVVGDTASVSEAADLHRTNSQIIIPFTSLMRRIDRSAADGMEIWMRVASPEDLDEIKDRVSSLMEQRRGTRLVEFTLLTVGDSVAAYTASSKTLALLLALISAISLLVGGVGVMNVMLIGVKERTREIGIRIAVGARASDVLEQILMEAVMLSLVGGIIGIVLGIAAARVVGEWNEWPLLITPSTVIGAFLLSTSVGIFFGYYPARRAASLDPIQALRSE